MRNYRTKNYRMGGEMFEGSAVDPYAESLLLKNIIIREPIYKEIIADFGFSEKDDHLTAVILDSLLKNHPRIFSFSGRISISVGVPNCWGKKLSFTPKPGFITSGAPPWKKIFGPASPWHWRGPLSSSTTWSRTGI